ncbi:MAG: tetratricopeptide repeat protein [Caldilinea sp.]|nr:tetratricopeptide repeat protein [Caldilinea sp.]MDW8440449.1 tetratricopeptide repeat protein [Caldilineaceae bacterium]
MKAFTGTGDLTVEDIVCEPFISVASHLSQAERAVVLARSSGENIDLIRALIRLARLRYRLGRYDAAQSLADEALSLTDAHASERADIWQVLANCAADAGFLSQAEAYYRIAADLARETGYIRAQVAALHGLAAGAYYPRGCFDLALAADAEVRRIAVEQGRSEWLIYPLITTALIYQLTGQRQLAHSTLDELATLAPLGRWRKDVTSVSAQNLLWMKPRWKQPITCSSRLAQLPKPAANLGSTPLCACQ